MKIKIICIIVFMFICQMSFATTKQLVAGPNVAHRIYNDNGERVGTCRRDNGVFVLYDMHEKKVDNPALFMNQPEDNCYIYNNVGYAIGKCTSSKVILFKF